MPIGDRDYVRGAHPPTCTCADCTQRRLDDSRRRRHPTRIAHSFSLVMRGTSRGSAFVGFLGAVWALASGLLRALVRLFLIVVSLCSGILGAHGLFVFILGTDILTSTNAGSLFLEWCIPGATISRVIEGVTLRSTESLIMPVVLVAVGVVTIITQASIAKRPTYRRIRFPSPARVSPLALFLALVGVVVIGYTISNWESMDQGVTALVIAANVIAVLWNLSIAGR